MLTRDSLQPRAPDVFKPGLALEFAEEAMPSGSVSEIGLGLVPELKTHPFPRLARGSDRTASGGYVQ